MATHSSILAWKIPWMEVSGGLQCTGHKESDTTERLHSALQQNSLYGFTPERSLISPKQTSSLKVLELFCSELI